MKVQETYTIDEKTYLISHWNPSKANKIFIWLSSTLSKGVNTGLENTDFKSLSEVEILSIIVKTIPSIIAGLDADVVDAKCKEILDGIKCDGKPVIYLEHFSGRLFHMYKVIGQVLYHQYYDFLEGGLVDLVSELLTPIEAKDSTTPEN